MGRATDQVARAVEPLLEAGEVVDVATIATFGKTSVARTAVIATATAVATAGMFMALTYAKKMPIVLTNKRLLVLDIKGLLFERADSKIVTQIARSDLRAKPPRQPFLWTKLDLTDTQGTPLVRLQFPLPNRGDAHRIAQALGEPPNVGIANSR